MYCQTSQEVKGNQTIEFGYLIEYNMRIIFLEKLCTKCDREISPRLPKYIQTKVLTTRFYLKYIFISCDPVCDDINFEISRFPFFVKAVFLYEQKTQDKHLNILRTKLAFDDIKSIIHHF